MDKDNWSFTKKPFIVGYIEQINNFTTNNTTVDIYSETVTVEGWILTTEHVQVDLFYLFLDDQPFVKLKYNANRPDVKKAFDIETNEMVGWHISFLSGFLENDCHNISVKAIDENFYDNLEPVNVCIRP